MQYHHYRCHVQICLGPMSVQAIWFQSPAYDIPTYPYLNTFSGLDDNCYVKRKTREKFYCDRCDYYSFNPDVLKCHVETIHIAKRYQCVLCEFAIYERDKLIKHIESKHPCDECQRNAESDEKTLTNSEQVKEREFCIHRDLSTLFSGKVINNFCDIIFIFFKILFKI